MIEQDDKIIISALKPEMVPMLWPKVKHMIQAACDHSNGELDIETIHKRILAKDMLLLLINEGDAIVAALTIEKRDFDTGKKVLNITTAGGADLHLWVDKVLAVAEGLAVEHGCEEVYIVGRAGWRKLLAKKGYETIHTVVAKKVGE